jgi:hypothetical protein
MNAVADKEEEGARKNKIVEFLRVLFGHIKVKIFLLSENFLSPDFVFLQRTKIFNTL